MKTQRRQELRTNELDQLLIDANAFFRKNGSYIAIGVILLALVFFGRWYLRDLSATAINAAYSQLVAMESATDDECRESIERLKERIRALRDRDRVGGGPGRGGGKGSPGGG